MTAQLISCKTDGMNIPVATDTVVRPSDAGPRGSLVQGDEGWGYNKPPRTTHDADKRTTMPKGRYAYGKSDPRLRPVV